MDYARERKQKPLPVIILTCIVLLIVMGIGIYLIKDAPSTDTSAKTPSTKKPVCTYDTHVCTFLANLTNTNALYNGPITATISVDNNQVMLQADTKNNVYITSLQNGKPQAELLTIGTLLYKKDANGVWKKQINIDNNDVAQFRTKAIQQVNKSGKNVTYTALGTTPCGELLCMQYQVSTPSQTNTKNYIFFDTKDYILRKVISEETNGTITETTFAYTPLTITPPPTQ